MKTAGDILSKMKFREPEMLAETDFDCPKHGKYTGRPIKSFSILRNNGNEGFITDPECPKCAEEETTRRKKAEAEDKKRKEIKLFVDMGIDEKYWPETLDTFNACTPELKKHLETVRKFSENPEDCKLVMLGENGNGKTHLAIGALKIIGGLIYTAYEIGLMLRESYYGTINQYEFLQKLCKTPLLVIDEVEKVSETQAKQNWLSHVIGKRYNKMLPVIFIANCHSQVDCTYYKAEHKLCSKCIEYHLENDVISRITEDGIIMKFSGEDYRYKKRSERRNRYENNAPVNQEREI
jgi:DNA replication protein DnaC